MKTIIAFFASCIITVNIASAGENPWGTFSKPVPISTVGWTRHAIEGYALPTSVKPNETIKFYVSVCDSGSEHQNYKIKIFRIPDTTTALYTSSVNTGRFYYLHDSIGGLIGIGDHSRKAVDSRRDVQNTGIQRPSHIPFLQTGRVGCT